MNLDDIIEFDEEGTNLDFKKEEYSKSDYVSLLKDVLSMANATNPETKRIVIGVKHRPGDNKEFIGIKKLSDQVILENIIQENIEPNINFKYYPYPFKNVTLGIIDIFDNANKPYMMKKDYGVLKKGEMWIRKGSRQSRVTREDIDKMFDYRKRTVFDNKVTIGFGKELNNETFISKTIVTKEEFPSAIRKKELEKLIERLNSRYFEDNVRKDIEKAPLERLTSIGMELFGEFRDSDKSIRVGYNRMTGLPIYKSKEQIQDDIKNIQDIYSEEDNYFLYEVNSIKFNCVIYNDGAEFLEDVKIEMYFNPDVFCISDEIYDDPSTKPLIYADVKPVNYNYPTVYEDDGYVVAEYYHNQIRHKTFTNVFDEDLRILVFPNVNVNDVKIKYRISAKNLATPIENSLQIYIK